jgi:hypothetical protein
MIKDCMIPMDKMLCRDKQSSKVAKGILYREDKDCFGRTLFTKVAENTVTLGGAIAALERLTGVEASFRPNTLNNILGVNDGYTYNMYSTPIALFGCGIGGAGLDFGNVYDPDVKQNNVSQLVPMMVSANSVTNADAAKYMMKTSVSTPDGTKLNCWYLKEFDATPRITSLWKDASSENEDGTEITSDISDSESENGVEALAQFKLVLNDEDVRSYFEAMGMLSQARINSIGLFVGEKVVIGSYQDYVNVSLFSVVNLENEALAERKTITYYYRVYAMV